MDPHQNVWNMWEGTTQFPAFSGFMAWNAFRIRASSSRPSNPVAQKRHVLTAALSAMLSCVTSMWSISVHGHFPLGLFFRIGSCLTIWPNRTFRFPRNFVLMASMIFFLIAGSLYPSSSRNLSVVVQRPPCFTKASIPDSNRAPSFSLWAHSVRWATSRHSWTGLDGDMVSMLYALHIINLCMSLHSPGVQS